MCLSGVNYALGVGFKRVLYSAALPTYTSDAAYPGDVTRKFYEYTTACMRNALSSVMAGHNDSHAVSKALRCWSGTVVERKPYSRKCAEINMGGVCPFNGVHTVCLR